MFNDEFLDSLSDGPYEATARLCEEFEAQHSQIPTSRKLKHHKRYLEAYAVLQPFAETLGLEIDALRPGKDRMADIEAVVKTFGGVDAYIEQGRLEETFAAMQRKYQSRFGTGFMYEFTDGDLKRIQELINELRGQITKSKLFDEKHRQRMLKRLEKLQAELHKKMSSVDQFWGLMNDAGVVMGKFGEDAKPLVDRYTEIVEIGWRSVLQAEQLPSGFHFPRLLDGKEKEEED